VLAASELTANAMLHAYPGRQVGRMVVSLTAFGPTHACLRVAHNGAGFGTGRPDLRSGIAAALAGVLEAELTYERTASWTLAEIMFPVRA
jgi:two-component sensor histidine kinase